MNGERTCPKCDASLTADAPEGLCPRCLVKNALLSEITTRHAATIVISPSQIVPETASTAAVGKLETEQLFGGYRIIQPLGKGGMGAVFEAEELASGRRVALKVLTHALDSTEARARFLREGRLAAAINHPNSVYVFGTEEIDSMPVITMELVIGGTLQQRVKEGGPLPIAGAVDGILQVIAGLEAAAEKGVLHRDVKPSNCFIDPDGTVKVGDFGLSISTLARADESITATGMFLGTPTYASPEQLRGEELDVRSDIYGVGVMLYYLLTGKTPFAGENMVQVLAAVLEGTPQSPVKWRPEIPRELANVILRCLARQKEHRVKSYAELRQALLPFDSTAPVPAPLGLRFCAGVLDSLILLGPIIVAAGAIAYSPELEAQFDSWVPKLFFAWALLYFSVSEGIWGASLGKAICQIRVVNRNSVAPGLQHAVLRSLIFLVILYVGRATRESLLPDYVGQATPGQPGFVFRIVAGLIGHSLTFLVLFCTARRQNGFAGLHDLASGTRVVRKRDLQARPGPLAVDQAPPQELLPFRFGPELCWLAVDKAEPQTEALPDVGPYHVLAPLDKTDAPELLLGYDPRLLRKVWIRKRPPGTPALDPWRHALGRPTRLRWLSGRRTAIECWDAFEAPTGESLLQRLNPPQSWRTARHWLRDLADELAAGVKDHSLPAVLALDRIWITEDGRAKLLDFRAPGINANGVKEGVPQTEPAPAQAEDRQAQMFLRQAAASALEGRIVPIEEAGERPVAALLPLHARSFLNGLPNPSGLEQVASQLSPLLHQVASISRARRAVLIAGCILPVLALVVAVFLTVSGGFEKNPDFIPLYSCLGRIEILERSAPTEDNKRERQALEIYVAANFRGTVTNKFFWPERGTGRPADKARLKEFRDRMRRILTERPAPSAEEIADATAVVKPFMDNLPTGSAVDFQFFFRNAFRYTAYGLALFVGVPAIVAAMLFRGGLLVHALGIAFVTRNGSPASRWCLLGRSLITWSPLLLLIILAEPASAGMIAAIIPLLYAVGAVWALAQPQRGLPDRIVGTWLVPR